MLPLKNRMLLRMANDCSLDRMRNAIINSKIKESRHTQTHIYCLRLLILNQSSAIELDQVSISAGYQLRIKIESLYDATHYEKDTCPSMFYVRCGRHLSCSPPGCCINKNDWNLFSCVLTFVLAGYARVYLPTQLLARYAFLTLLGKGSENEKEGEKEKDLINQRLERERERQKGSRTMKCARCVFILQRNRSTLLLMVAIAMIIRTRWRTNGNAHYVSAINPFNRIARRLLCRLRVRNYVYEVSTGLMGISFVNSIDCHETFRENDEEERNIFFKHLFRNVNCKIKLKKGNCFISISYPI